MDHYKQRNTTCKDTEAKSLKQQGARSSSVFLEFGEPMEKKEMPARSVRRAFKARPSKSNKGFPFGGWLGCLNVSSRQGPALSNPTPSLHRPRRNAGTGNSEADEVQRFRDKKCHSVGPLSSPGAEAARRGRPSGGGEGAEARTPPRGQPRPALPAPRPERGKPARGRIQQERRAARLPPGKQPPGCRALGEGRRGAGGGAAGSRRGPPAARKVTARRPPPSSPRAPQPCQGGKFNFQRVRLSPRRGGSAPAVGPSPPPPQNPAHAPGPRPTPPGPAAARQPAAAAPDAGRRVSAGRRAALEPRHRLSRGGGR
ncbi:uncharacterized protein LOC114888093 [Monodon monoceros]|uniref:uncharacterized protein LOC114888093 n=1 Tax=Monodon monoceros TaxID=40151 RepID=UPI0010F8204C|nr:uncharacterized protein LOC114888093 [Monodon monoceros]